MPAGAHAADRHLLIVRDSPVHRIGAEAKIVVLVVFVACVALTPRHAVAAFAVDAAVLAAVFVAARLPLGALRRLVVIVPFVAFAAFVPFISGGEQVDVAGIGMSVDGLWATWNIVAKATLGALASILLSATTTIPDVLRGLARLRIPATIVAIMAFMFRYLDLLADQLRRMRAAMTARGHDPRWLWQAGPIGSSVGVLFVRSYERGERVHQAMLARGYTGTMPDLDDRPAATRDWWAAAPVGGIAVITLAVALVTT